MEDVLKFVNPLVENVERVIVGKRLAIEYIMVAVLCEGHVLLEDVPGSGKTMLARSIAASLGISFKRVQCTPDLLPNDITGVVIIKTLFGPVFAGLSIGDSDHRKWYFGLGRAF